jgi:hypothetical protein
MTRRDRLTPRATLRHRRKSPLPGISSPARVRDDAAFRLSTLASHSSPGDAGPAEPAEPGMCPSGQPKDHHPVDRSVHSLGIVWGRYGYLARTLSTNSGSRVTLLTCRGNGSTMHPPRSSCPIRTGRSFHSKEGGGRTENGGRRNLGGRQEAAQGLPPGRHRYCGVVERRPAGREPQGERQGACRHRHWSRGVRTAPAERLLGTVPRLDPDRPRSSVDQ